MADSDDAIARRKADHLRINLEEDVRAKGVDFGFERFRFEHQALPEIDLASVSTVTNLFGRELRAPLLISSMTGGVERGRVINRNLAIAAQQLGVAMGLGSQRLALEAAERETLFQVRDAAPDILLFANLGAAQLNYGYGVEECARAVTMVEADALILHLNPLQEAVQPEGTTNFAGLAARIAAVCRDLPVPVVIKEVGWGISETVARTLADAGVAAIDVAGAGGTSWSEVERHRAGTERARRVAAAFASWGIGTAESVQAVRRGAPGLPVFASGGIRDGIDVAKAVGMGATLAGLASPVLRAAVQSADAVVEELSVIVEELRIAMFCLGAASLPDLKDSPYLIRV